MKKTNDILSKILKKGKKLKAHKITKKQLAEIKKLQQRPQPQRTWAETWAFLNKPLK
jgi:ribosomal protein S7